MDMRSHVGTDGSPQGVMVRDVAAAAAENHFRALPLHEPFDEHRPAIGRPVFSFGRTSNREEDSRPPGGQAFQERGDVQPRVGRCPVLGVPVIH